MRVVDAIIISIVAAASSIVEADLLEKCGGFQPPVWDYADRQNWQPTGDAPQTRIKLVENSHFNAGVERLVKGQTAANPVADITYTLRRFPNHSRALWALSRASRHPQWKTATSFDDVVCYFERALRFRSKDPTVWMIYGMHLQQEGKYDDSAEKYARAEQLGLNSSEFHYNYGLLLADKGDFGTARMHAEKAYQMGYPLPGLRRKLAAAGHWPQEQP